jgi:hypothetical protein
MRSYLAERYQRAILNNNSNKVYSEWELTMHGVPQGLTVGPLLCLLYINDLQKLISDVSNPILFADDTSIIVSNADSLKFKLNASKILEEINNWFQSNLLSLNHDRTYFSQFLTKKK